MDPEATRPYFDDPYTTAFEAVVVDTRDDAEGRWVALERSWFYPTGGGQECDRGTLGASAVVQVEEDAQGQVWHRVEGDAPAAGARLPATIDAGRRRGFRQQHTGQHLLSAAFERVLSAYTVSSRLGEFEGTIDLDRTELSWDDVARVEEAANRVVWDDREVASVVVAPEELALYPLRKPPKVTGPVRLIVVPDFDCSPCGGTHVTRTGEIGAIKVRRWERWKGGVRVEFVCGARALADHQDRVEQMVEAALRAHTGDAEVIPLLERAQAEKVALAKQVKRLGEELAQAEALAWALARSASPGRAGAGARGWARIVAERDPAALKALATAAIARGAPVVVVAALLPEPTLVILRARDLPDPDLRTFAAELKELAGGKGGGGADLLTLVAADEPRLRATFARACTLVGAREDGA
jgi:alanyl-tRNA synthetase